MPRTISHRTSRADRGEIPNFQYCIIFPFSLDYWAMRRAPLLSLLLVEFLTVCAIFPLQLLADEGPLVKDQPTGMTVDEVIKRFTEKEKRSEERRVGKECR